MTRRGPGTSGPGRGAPGGTNGPGGPSGAGAPGGRGGAGRWGRPDSQGRPGPGGRRPGDPRAGAGPNPVIPPRRTPVNGPRLARDGGRRPGQDPSLPGNARLPGGQGARRPGPGTRPPGGPRRPPRRPPRWLTVRRGEPGRRVGVTFLSIAIVLTLFAGRLVQIQVLQSAYYKKAANAEKLTTKALPALRGTIYGANGQQILAMTIETYTIAADPTQIPDADRPGVAQKLAGLLGTTPAQVLYLLRHPASSKNVILAKGVSTANETEIESLGLTGIYPSPVYVRAYPDGDATANVVGFTNVNPVTQVITGQSGIEAQYNRLLTGTTGSERVEIGADGVAIPLAGTQATPAKDGQSIRLTIIPALQFQAQQACQQEVEKTHAANCSVVVIQPKTGAILAMAQWPTYDQDTFTSVSQTTDLPDSYLFAPGSTAKVITAAAAFETGGQTPMSAYNIPYQIYRGGQWIHDAEWSPGERYTIAGIIANSSNIGMSQVVGHVSPQVQYDYLKAFGLGEPTGLGLPGEEPDAAYSAAALPPPSRWAADERYTLSYGQGVSVNAVQMASVYATIANGGVRVQPTLVAGTYNAAGQYVPAKPPASRRVIQAKTAQELIPILQQVPAVDDQANQRWGDFPGYAIAAKTGTSNEPSADPAHPCPKGNPLCVYGASYIGMAPGNGPQVVVAVNVQDPKTNHDYFGMDIAGPVFYSVMNAALQTLQIQPQPGLVAPYVRLNAR